MTSLDFATLTSFSALNIAVWYFVGRQVGVRHNDRLIELLYLYALTLVFIFFIALWDVYSGDTDACGKNPGPIGKPFNKFLEYCTDVRSEFLLIAVLGAFYLIPSILTYFVAGIFGTARWISPLYFMPRILIFSIAKFLMVFSPIMISYLTWRKAYNCEYFSAIDLIASITVSLFSMLLSFATVYLYLEKEKIRKFLATKSPQILNIGLEKIRNIIKRNLD